jgi:hypothetical protein
LPSFCLQNEKVKKVMAGKVMAISSIHFFTLQAISSHILLCNMIELMNMMAK